MNSNDRFSDYSFLKFGKNHRTYSKWAGSMILLSIQTLLHHLATINNVDALLQLVEAIELATINTVN